MTVLTLPARILLFFAGLTGAAGIMLAAASYHGDSAVLLSAALVCLANGPALIGLALLSMRTAAALAAGTLMVFGTVMFAGDLVARAYLGFGFFPMAAPIGGTSVIASWLLVALAALMPARKG
ncbi:DUF423 domain-containing protein [Martelella lutilitoris]|uniref:DUF423 domain-containing protein n=1 Tax=Martelella lutilitoris TaxID=2583532 RepID=A0A5C4JQ09_9HYPH|nr:DUF423 domain-containing protein [Martelella lutilitoris]TNB47486.1 DUF423 domain-containing protein [Martelella lutilitoris]